MKHFSLLTALHIAFVATLICIVSCKDLNYAERTCQGIVGADPSISIFWIGLLRTRFILITNTLAVYDLAPSALDNQARKLYLSSPRPLKEIYPNLHSSMTADGHNFFKGGQKRLCVTDAADEYLYSESEDCKRGSLYNYKTGQPSADEYAVTDQVTNGGKCTKVQMLSISSVEPLTFYAIYYSDSKDPSGMILKANFKSSNDLRHSTTLQQSSKPLHICRVDTSSDKIVFSADKCGKAGVFLLNAAAGFADNHNLYIIAANQTVFIFAKAAIDTPGTPQRVYKVQFEDFFICTGSGAGFWIGVAIVVGLLVCCLLVVCICFAMRKSGRSSLLARNNTQAASASKNRTASRSKSRPKGSKKKIQVRAILEGK